MRRLVRQLLLLLVVVVGLARNGCMRAKPREVRRILLIRPDHLGDLLFTTPALAEVRRSFPGAHLTYLVGPWSREVVARNSHVDEVRTYAFPGFRRDAQGALEPYRLLWRLSGELRRQQYDLAIVLRPDFWWGVWLVYLAGIPLRLGHAHPLQTRFLTWALPVHEGEHAASQNMRLARAAAQLAEAHVSLLASNKQDDMEMRAAEATRAEEAQPGQPALEFVPTEEECAWVRARLAQTHIGETKKLIVIHPGTGAPVKLWEPTSWAQVADTLIRSYGIQVVLTGAESERELVDDIAHQMQEPVFTLIGETDVGKLAALLARATLVLGVDNGPLHLATAQGTPTVRLYGPTDPRIFGPWGDSVWHRVLQAKRPCIGCAAIPCGRLDWRPEELAEHPCVRSIPVEEMLSVVRQVLARQQENKP